MTQTTPQSQSSWLTRDELEDLRMRVPILYVDAIPVRVDTHGIVTSIGLLLRATSQGTITIPDGQTTGTLVIPSGNTEDVYNDPSSLTATITSAMQRTSPISNAETTAGRLIGSVSRWTIQNVTSPKMK